ncbi:MAG TPA: hypothetical protein VM536_03155, partial [Chloroflexia bacterium]|nr:hypothetical protein [Chloroflexia bacterium]
LVAGLLPALGAGTLGGNHNHLLDLTAGCCLGFGLGAAALRQGQVPQLRLAGAGVLLLLAAATGSLYATPHWLGHEFRLPPREVQEGLRNIAQYTSNTPGYVYSTDLSLLLATGKWQPRLWTTDPYTQTHATFFGRWDESALVAAIRARAFALIIIPPDLNLGSATADAGVLSLGIQQAIADAYHLDQRNVLFLYKPNTP